MILLRYLLKNVVEKPFRTLLLVLCTGCCAFVGAMSLDMMGSIEVLMKTMLMQVTGSSDIAAVNYAGAEEKYPLSMENEQLLVYEMQGGTITFADGEYTYYHKTPFSIRNLDYETAAKMRLLPAGIELAEDEAAVTKIYELRNDCHLGDTITLYDTSEKPHTYKVTQILLMKGLANGVNGVFLSDEGYGALTRSKKADLIYIDILDDSRVTEAKEELERLAPGDKFQVLLEDESTQEEIKSFEILFFTVFVICFLMVIFVAFSVLNRIVCERVAVAGTFRSLGMSAGLIMQVLLAENILYGLLGATVGTAFYVLLRQSVFNSIFSISASAALEVNVAVPPVSPSVYLSMVVLECLVMVLCPLKEVIRTSRMAIRDIIYDSADTEYRMSRATKIAGVICTCLAVVLFFFPKNVTAQLGCFALFITACAFLFPYLLRAAAFGLQKLFEKWDKPIARLAALECCSRKSTVGSAILCMSASVLATVIFIFVSTVYAAYDVHPYDCDVRAVISGKRDPAYFSYIKDLEGVEETELLYINNSCNVKIGEKTRQLTVFGCGEEGFRLFAGIRECPAQIGRDSFVMDRSLAERFGLAVGDTVDFTFDADSFMPITKEMTLQALCDGFEYDTAGNVIVLSKDTFIDMYHDRPGEILIRCSNPQEIVAQVENYSGAMMESVMTIEEFENGSQDTGDSMESLLIAVIVIGIGLAVVGMMSNQLIGFEGRRRECAVLVSTAMTKEQLARMFLLESALMAGISLLAAFPAAVVAFIPIRRIMEILTAAINCNYNIGVYIPFVLVLWIVFALTGLSPVKKMKKMNLAMQLKYE